VLERAYNDAQGITAEFNLNVLSVLNKMLSAEFDLNRFRHHAFYNREESQIEMHLISEREQDVAIKDLDVIIPFEKNESIRTEISCKYTRKRVEKLLRSAGLELTEWYTDKQDNFALSLSRLQSSS
jgi:L-histidine N-alpha-methyltransferase